MESRSRTINCRPWQKKKNINFKYNKIQIYIHIIETTEDKEMNVLNKNKIVLTK